MNNKYLLIENNCASDAREHFNKRLKEITGLNINDFKRESIMTSYDSNYTVKYIYDGYLLEYFPSNPHYHLSLHKCNCKNFTVVDKQFKCKVCSKSYNQLTPEILKS